MKLLKRLITGVLLGALIQTCYAGFIPKQPLQCSVGSFDAQNVQLKCGKDLKQKRQMNRVYFEKVYGEPTEGKIVKIDTSNSAAANRLKSY
jgi:hypothetical protein